MWGENSVGRKISLLNEDHDLVAQTASSGTRAREGREEGRERREKREKAGLVSPTLLHTPANTIINTITNTLITTNTTATSSLLSSSRQRPPLPNRSRQSSSSSSSASTSDHSSSSSTAASSTSTSSTASYSAAQSPHRHHHHHQQHHYSGSGSGSGSCRCCRDTVGSSSSSLQRHPVRPELPGIRKHSSYTSSRPPPSSSCATSYTSSRARSPPTPPLHRLDSFSSTSTRRSASSPKTPNDLPELMDPANPKAAAAVAAAGYPYYPSTNRPGTLPLPDHAYYSLPGQQALPPMPPVDLDDAYASLPAQRFPPSIHPITAAGSAPLALSPTASSPAHSLVTGPGAYYPSAAPSFASMSPTSPQAPVGRPTRTEAASTHNTISKPRAHSPPSTNGTPKKKYPCPHAATFGCHDTFTTSGHAARHGKKHTGEKNVRCPTCGKAFTRKDNMKQHERTHKTGNASHGHASSPTTATARSERGRSRRASEGHGARAADVMDIDSSNASPSISQHPNIHSSPSASSNPSVPTLSNASTLSLSASSSLSPPATNPTLAANHNGQSLERPKMQRSELSEILETYNQTAAAAAPLPLDINTYGIDPAGPNLMSDPSGLAALNLKADPALGATGPLMPMDMDSAAVAGYPTAGTLPPMNGIDAEGDSPGLDALASMAAVAGTHP